MHNAMKYITKHIRTLIAFIAILLFAGYITNAEATSLCYINETTNLYSLPIGDSAPRPATERAEALTKSMNCEIGLLGKQVPKVYAINLEACLKMDSIAIQNKDNISLYNANGKKIDEERNTELRNVLTPKQFSQYERISRGNRRALKNTAVCRDPSKTW